jgi:uncharacterized protein YacL
MSEAMASSDRRLRVVAGVLVVALGAAGGRLLATPAGISPVLTTAAGAAAGALVLWLESRAVRLPVDRLFWGVAGGGAGLIAGLAAGLTLVPLVGVAAPGLLGALGAYLGAAVATRRLADLAGLSARIFPPAARGGASPLLLDTSVIIDGRIADLCATGFVDGRIVIPRFVLAELQRIADAGDAGRRSRGKRGFAVVQALQRAPRLRVEVVDTDVPGVAEVDRKLVALAQTLGARLVTNDMALHALADVSGVTAVSINALAAALRPAVQAGEVLTVQVLREGKEPGQGVGYLDDGTMVVVEQGRAHVGRTIDVTVTSVLQTSAGRMIFGRAPDRAEGPAAVNPAAVRSA